MPDSDITCICGHKLHNHFRNKRGEPRDCVLCECDLYAPVSEEYRKATEANRCGNLAHAGAELHLRKNITPEGCKGCFCEEPCDDWLRANDGVNVQQPAISSKRLGKPEEPKTAPPEPPPPLSYEWYFYVLVLIFSGLCLMIVSYREYMDGPSVDGMWLEGFFLVVIILTSLCLWLRGDGKK